MTIARRCGFDAGLNDPFAGGHVIERHARPARGVHALQIELDRRAYLDPKLRTAGPGFDKGALLIEALAVDLGEPAWPPVRDRRRVVLGGHRRRLRHLLGALPCCICRPNTSRICDNEKRCA